MRHLILVSIIVALSCLFAVDAPAQEIPAAGYARVVPVPPQGLSSSPYPAGTTIQGDTIVVPGGPMRLWFDFEVGGWAPLQIDILQVSVDTSGFVNGVGSDLTIPAWLSCGDETVCEAEFGPGSVCQTQGCQFFYVDRQRTNVPLSTHIASNAQLLAGFTGLPGSPLELEDLGVPYLVATLTVDVPAGADGVYSVGILCDYAKSFLDPAIGEGHRFAECRSAQIVVGGECCAADGSCGVVSFEDCTISGGSFVAACMGDCNGNGQDDACESLADCNVNGVPDECEVGDGTAPDCNNNGIPDECDILLGSSTDCDANAVPDECDFGNTDCNSNGRLDICDVAAGATDCDGNAVPDECELADGDCNNSGVLDVCEDPSTTDCNANGVADFCELGAGVAVDCNGNGVLDECDIAGGTSPDVDGNCIPDECDPSPAPLAESPLFAKSRFLSFTPLNAGCSTALRVKFVLLTPEGVGAKFAALEDTWQWVGPPQLAWEDSRRLQQLQVAALQCDPHVMAWQGVGLVNVYGAAIMPESVYDVQHFDAACGDVNDPGCYSNGLMITTDVWGDVVSPYDGEPDAGGQPDFRDIADLVVKFQALGGPSRTAAELEPNVLDLSLDLDFKDIAACVTSFQDKPYPLAGPTACP